MRITLCLTRDEYLNVLTRDSIHWESRNMFASAFLRVRYWENVVRYFTSTVLED